VFLLIIGNLFRKENWEFDYPWNFNLISSFSLNSFRSYDSVNDSLMSKQIPIINGKKEACLSCHSDVSGFSASHDPSIFGCSSCHLGNPYTFSKDQAHYGMILIPGNLDNAKQTCEQNNCHPNIIGRIENSLMTTMSGVVSVDKFVFGETDDLDKHYRISKIDYSQADKHLRNLCASCHLEKKKLEFGEINELSRGGGCNACHLNYTEKAKTDLKKYLIDKSSITKGEYAHPALNIQSDNSKCFGCHSRSGRISLCYEGWHETHLDPKEVKGQDKYRLLMDGRVVEKHKPDVHHERGMECIDCHLSYELMGNYKTHFHKEEQIIIRCEDCHITAAPKTKKYNELDFETQRIIDLRKNYPASGKYIVSSTGYTYPNVFYDNDLIKLKVKNKDTLLYPKRPITDCAFNIEGHKSLTCKSCHSDWSPQCLGCHTEYNKNVKGYDNLTDKWWTDYIEK